MTEQELFSLSDEDLLEKSSQQKQIGVLGISLQLSICLLNVVMLGIRIHQTVQKIRTQKIGDEEKRALEERIKELRAKYPEKKHLEN